MSGSSVVKIGDVPVGDGHPTVVAAEISTFFNQDIELGKRLIRRSVEAGAHILKGEILHDPEVCRRSPGLVHAYKHAKGSSQEDYRALIERKTVSLDRYRELFGVCRELGVPAIASVYDIEGIDFFAEIGGAGLKIARPNIDNIPLIRHAARSGLPVVFDAGVTYFDEVTRAVRLAQEEGAGGVIVNHHPGKSPAPPEAHHMRVMQSYKRLLGVPVGLSCHFVGDEILYLAVGMGANLLEKGVTVDPKEAEQDVVFAASLDDLPTIVRKVENCWKAIGEPVPKHAEPRDLSGRAGLVAKRDLKPGETLDTSTVLFAWPPEIPDGIMASHWDIVKDRKLKRAVEANDVIYWRDVDF